MPTRAVWRETALFQAIGLHQPRGNMPAILHPPMREILRTATELYDWLAQPVHLSLTFGETNMSNVELGDNQKVSATVVPDDAAGQPTVDTLSWTASVPTAVSLTPSADTLSCVINGLVPTAGVVITATDPNGLAVSGTVDVIAGAATSLNLTFGPVTAVTPAAAAAETPVASA
jgi:hypothetical protein